MKWPKRSFEWTPSSVSWLSFVLMGLIVAGVGLTGTAQVVQYLQKRLIAHGIEHNQQIAAALLPMLQSGDELAGDSLGRPQVWQQAFRTYAAFGYRIFVIDREQQTLVADSHRPPIAPQPIADTWLADAVTIENGDSWSPLRPLPSSAHTEDGHPVLMCFHEMDSPDAGSNPWLLGIASNERSLHDFMGDLHWHLDAVMVLTYVLIALLGYFAMRSIGRTYERRLESQVLERTRELESAHAQMLHKTRLATIGQTASVLTHEMRSPLASIKLFLSSLKGSAGLPDRARHRVELVLGEVDRLEGLLSDSLDYVRPIKLSAEPVDMDRLLSQVLKQQEPLMKQKAIGVRRRTCPDCPALRLDQPQMYQVLLNLLNNAVEASPRGGEIGVSLVHQGEELVVEMTNGGDPLDAATLERAFEPFFTTKPKGTGLGLGLARRVTEEHGGRVSFSTDPGSLTRVSLRLPLRRP